MATIFNQATLAYNGQNILSNRVSGEVLEVITATKTAVSGTYREGDTVTYVVSLINSGTDAVTGITLSDDLGSVEATAGTPAYTPLTYIPNTLTYFVNGTPATAPTVGGDNPLQLTNITVPAGGNVTIIYSATVNDSAPLAAGNTINNTATVSAPSLSASVTAEATISTVAEPRLSILKTLTPTEIMENGQVTYTFVIENRGNTAAENTVVLTDVFNPILSNVTAFYNGTVWTLNTDYTYNETNGTFESVPGAITVPAATYERDAATGAVTIVPGVATIRIEGTI